MYRTIQQQPIFTAETDYSSLNERFEGRPLDDLLTWSLTTFGDKVIQVTSFGPTGMVLLDHLTKLSPGIKVLTIDTDFLFEETYALRELVQRRYPIQLEIRKSALSPAAQAEKHGDKLWEATPDKCCHIRKVVPLANAMRDYAAWYTGLRRDQSSYRAAMPIITWDQKYSMVKINAMAQWTRNQIWGYIVENNVPYNPLHDQGYPSIGCTYCTQSSTDLTDERAGRWAGFQKTECGLHI